MTPAQTQDLARRRLQDQRHNDLIQEEARMANDLMRQHPDVSRTDALKAAHQAMRQKHGEPYMDGIRAFNRAHR
ncbi:hypothetical protein [Cupriavidus sp. RAF12]|uniref:hypothetical protein n=1 Tax=Cupriavidus sp. RAF12 TaxID=3233050 RepID=UPI003F917E5E